MPRLVAGVDSSTQSTKVEVRDLDTGAVVARGAAPHPATTPPRSEQDPHSWWAAFETAWAAAGSPTVEAISVAGQQHGMVVLDAIARGDPPGQAVERHRDRTRRRLAAQAAAGRRGRLGGSRRQRAGRGVHVTKLSWLHRSEPENWARLAHVVLPHDWMTFRLTGELVTDRGDASGTGYWSPSTGEYRWDILVDHRQGPRLVDGGAPGCRARPRWSASGTAPRWPAAPATTWPPRSASACSRGWPCCRSARPAPRTRSATEPTADVSGAVAGLRRCHRAVPAAGVHAQRHQGDRRRRPPPRCRPRRVRSAGARRAGGAGGLTLLPYFDGERTPNLPEGDRAPRRDSQRRVTRAARPRRGRRRGVRFARRARRPRRAHPGRARFGSSAVAPAALRTASRVASCAICR